MAGSESRASRHEQGFQLKFYHEIAWIDKVAQVEGPKPTTLPK